jgi:prefoldin alpha subunit
MVDKKVDNKTTNPKKITLNKNQTISLYQNKERELQKISSKLQEINSILNEINKAESTLKELENIKNKEKVMVNIGAGVLMSCAVSTEDSVKVMLPGSIIVDKASKDVIKDLEGRKKELVDAKNKLIANYQNTIKTLNTIKQAMQQMQSMNNQNNSVPTNVN